MRGALQTVFMAAHERGEGQKEGTESRKDDGKLQMSTFFLESILV